MVDGFLGGGQRLLPAAHLGQPVGEVVQRHGEVGQVGVRGGLGQPAVELDGLLGAAASASSRRPTSASRLERLFSDIARSGR